MELSVGIWELLWKAYDSKMSVDDDSIFISCEVLIIHYKIVYEIPYLVQRPAPTLNITMVRIGAQWDKFILGRPRFDNSSNGVSIWQVTVEKIHHYTLP